METLVPPSSDSPENGYLVSLEKKQKHFNVVLCFKASSAIQKIKESDSKNRHEKKAYAV